MMTFIKFSASFLLLQLGQDFIHAAGVYAKRLFVLPSFVIASSVIASSLIASSVIPSSEIRLPVIRNLGLIIRLVIGFVLALTFSLPSVALEVKVSSSTVALNKTLQLEISSHSQQSLNTLDISGLERDFIVGRPSVSSALNIINRRSSASQTIILILQPRRLGQARIPALRHDQRSSRPITIEVTAAVANPDSLYDGAVIARGTSSKDRVYVGESFVYSLKLYHQLDQKSRFGPVTLDWGSSEVLSARSYRETLNGKSYQVQEQRYLITAKEAGVQQIDSPLLRGELYRSSRSFFRASGVPFELEAKPIRIEVAAIPISNRDIALVAESLDISEATLDSAELRVGQPITRRIEMFAKGIKAELLPDLVIADQPQLRAYEEPSKFHNEEWLGGYTGSRTETFALIPTQSGEIELPAIEIEWWNSRLGQLETSVLPATRLSIAPAAAGDSDRSALNESSANPPAVAEASLTESSYAAANAELAALQQQLRRWQALSAAGFGLSVILLAGLVAKKRRLPPAADGADAATSTDTTSDAIDDYRRQILQACGQNDLVSAQRALNRYCQLREQINRQAYQQSNQKKASTEHTALHNDLAAELAVINQALYARNNAGATPLWRGKTLAAALKRDVKLYRQSRSQRQPALTTLYPSVGR